MVPVRVLGLAVDTDRQPVVLLTPLDSDRADVGGRTVVPIWIGPQEAASIGIAVGGETPPRPLSHDLMQRLLEAVGARLDRVDVTRIEDGTFYAELGISTRGGAIVLDCRPSDAIALATRTGAPIFVADQVLADAGVQEEPDQPAKDDRDSDERVAEFRRFLDDVDPEDFQG